MSSLPSSPAKATQTRASSLFTYFLTRIVIALMLTGIDIFVLLKSAVEGLRNSIGMSKLHWLIVGAAVGIALSLANVWYKTLRYRQPSKPNSRNPFL
jgi:hypothetical protein